MSNFKQLWRPLLAIVFGLTLAFRYWGLIDPALSEKVEILIIETMKYFMILYAGGRTVEKAVEVGKPLFNKLNRIVENEEKRTF